MAEESAKPPYASSTSTPLSRDEIAMAILADDLEWMEDLFAERPNLRLHLLAADAALEERARKIFADGIESGQLTIFALNRPSEDPDIPWAPSVDQYCADHGITWLSLLRIGPTGREMELLRGATRMLRAGSIDVVHFDYGPHFRASGQTLRQLHAFITPLGYLQCKVLDAGIKHLREIAAEDEDYQPAEYIAALPRFVDLGDVRDAIPADMGHGQQGISCEALGTIGRFGNQIFQYAFMRILARRHGLDVKCPKWIGNDLFGHSHPAPTNDLPRLIEGREILEGVFPRELFGDRIHGIDLFGFFMFDTVHYAPYRDFFRSLFRPLRSIEAGLKPAIERLRDQGRTIVALHLRRGDFGNSHLFLAPEQWYLDALAKLWPTLAKPILVLASDEVEKVRGAFAEYEPTTAAELGLSLDVAPFYPDFYMLTQADVLAISNSTFSFTAAMLNQRAKVFLRPHLFLKRLIPFDPWNSTPLLHQELHKRLAEVIPKDPNAAPPPVRS